MDRDHTDGEGKAGGGYPAGVRPGALDGFIGLKLVELSSVFICVCLDNHVLYINRAGARLVGFDDPESAVGHPVADLFHPDYRDFIDIGLEAFADEEGGVPLKFVRRDGAVIDVDLAVSILDEEGPLFLLEVRDITEFKRASEALRGREERLQGILNAVNDGIVTIDETGTIQSFNPAAQRIFGYSAAEAVGQNVRILMPEPYRSDHDGYLRAYLATGAKHVLGSVRELQGQRKDGGIFALEISISELRCSGSHRLFTGILRDITARKEAEARIRHLAHHDTLTGLPNRHLFNDRLDAALRRAARHGHMAALMFVDLDRFKPINDAHGHEAGDLVLQAVAERIKACVRASDTVARLGGDEFVVVIEDMEDAQSAGVVGRKVLEGVSAPVELPDGETCAVGASIGIAVFPHDADEADALIRCADDAMYRVKASGRNDVRFFRAPLNVVGAR